jgi:flap endonuclease-1
MGLQIKDIVPKKEIKIEDLKGKIICVDAFNTIYQFLTTIRQPDGTSLQDKEGRITSHLSGLFYRNMNMLLQGLKIVYVFDGVPPALKGSTFALRREAREKAKGMYESAKNEEDIEMMKRYSSQLVRLDDDMIAESKELLKAMGIAVIQAPGEGEAEAAHLAKKKEVYAAASQDYDSLLFGAPRLIQNLTLAKRRKTISGWVEVKPMMIELNELFKELEINHDQLICIGILTGTDYNPGGIKGIGPKKALALVKELKKPEKIFESVKDRIEGQETWFDWREIFKLFEKPDVKDSEIKFPKFDEEKIKNILVPHGFSEDRLESQFKKMQEYLKEKKQKGLKDFF